MTYPQSAFLFYEIMKYPLPAEEYFFAYGYKGQAKHKPTNKYTYNKKLLDEYTDYINQNMNILASIPFVSHIYLCNSMTFNALHDNSDIDLTIIADEGRIRTAKLCTTIMLMRHKMRRRGVQTRKKFCTSFYLTPSAANLYPIKLPHQTDIYLIYRIAHLVPLYSRTSKDQDFLIKTNKWIQHYLPQHPLSSLIDLNINPRYNSSTTKNRWEKILGGTLGDIIEKCIKIIRSPLIIYKKKRNHHNDPSIIISDTMMKFHEDKRNKYQFLFDLAQRKNT